MTCLKGRCSVPACSELRCSAAAETTWAQSPGLGPRAATKELAPPTIQPLPLSWMIKTTVGLALVQLGGVNSDPLVWCVIAHIHAVDLDWH
jgi:hypothetical protein